jgi:hypothetical protein
VLIKETRKAPQAEARGYALSPHPRRGRVNCVGYDAAGLICEIARGASPARSPTLQRGECDQPKTARRETVKAIMLLMGHDDRLGPYPRPCSCCVMPPRLKPGATRYRRIRGVSE